MNRSQDFEIYEPDALLNLVLSRTDVEGVTLSGGEPFQQSSEALEMFLSGIKNRSNLSVMVYTGGLKEDLEQDPASRDLLKYVDLLVDGPYVESLDQGQLWRGSANQRFHFLTTRYADLAPWLNEKKGRPLEVEFLTGVDFALTGIPPKDFKEKLAQSLDRKGMTINL